jgi:hypothetical protein
MTEAKKRKTKNAKPENDWSRFEQAVDAVLKAPPNPKVAKRPSPKKKVKK